MRSEAKAEELAFAFEGKTHLHCKGVASEDMANAGGLRG